MKLLKADKAKIRDGILEQGENAVIYELQGAYFFGTASQLFSVLEHDIKTKKFIV